MQVTQMYRILIILLLVAITQSPSLAANANPMVHQVGTTIVDAQGNSLRLRSVQLEGWLQWAGLFYGASIFTSGTEVRQRIGRLVGQDGEQTFERAIYDDFVTEADIAKIAALGFNSVRLPITAHLLQDPSQPQLGWELMDRTLSWCEKYHVYVIIDLHSAPGGQSRLATVERDNKEDLLWNSEADKQRTVELWKAIASRYCNRRIVAGYDLLNEPVVTDSTQLVQLYRRIIEAIRAVDRNHMVILEGGKMASDFSMFDQPLCDNQLYSFHIYTWFGDDRREKLANYRALAERQHVPLWVGEFGANTYEMIDSTLSMFDQVPEIVGWNYWTWKKAPSKYPGLVSLQLPSEWKPVASWISLPLTTKPDAKESARGLQQLAESTKLANTSLDSRMAAILVSRRH